MTSQGLKKSNSGTGGLGSFLPITFELAVLEQKITVPSKYSHRYAYAYDDHIRTRSRGDLRLRDL